jgi:hypothetical protein
MSQLFSIFVDYVKLKHNQCQTKYFEVKHGKNWTKLSLKRGKTMSYKILLNDDIEKSTGRLINLWSYY